ncbi:MAG: MptD family putative ECF transporter S component [Oscillospiraceae bacterium]|nr:MptD family putative ECF transporter S component [Oscillospiraceae bacterium]
METQSNKLTGKDLINVGIYSAIYFVIVFLIAMLGMVPILYPMLVVFCPIIGGIPFMLFLTKVKKPGMIFIMSILMGLLMLVSGMGIYPLIVSVFSGLLSEVIYRKGNYSSAKMAVLTNGTFSLWVWACFLLLFLNRDSYMASRAESVGQEYVDALNKLTPGWLCPVLLIICFVCGIIGGLIGKKMMHKHFEKAGIA